MANGWEAVHNLIGAFLPSATQVRARCCVSLCKWRDASEIENPWGVRGAFSTSAQLIVQIVLPNYVI